MRSIVMPAANCSLMSSFTDGGKGKFLYSAHDLYETKYT